MINQAEAKLQLISLLKEKRAILMVGAGSSKFAGYPLWEELLDELKKGFAPSLQISTDNSPQFVDSIKAEAINCHRENEYYKFLYRRFAPKSNSQTHNDFHSNLVNLGFRGIVTTNYDIVLESAIMGTMGNNDEFYTICDSIDLCDEVKSYLVSGFLRSLSDITSTKNVLHLHGYYKEPKRIILTEGDYQTRYGNLDSAGNEQHVPLDTLHRKVIWTLLATHSVVFVGFKMTDPFFMRLLEINRKDLNQDGDKLHFAILPDADKGRAKLLIQKYCVQPVFYDVVNVEGIDDHSDLKKLIFDLASEVGVSIGSSDIASITKRMLGR